MSLIDLSQLPPPAALEAWSFDAIVGARTQGFLAEWQVARTADPTLPLYDVQSLSGNPVNFWNRAASYREGLVRQRVNEAVAATFLAWAQGDDLTDRAADWGVARIAGEGDASLRRRAQLKWEALSIGGSYGGYTFRALSAAPAEIRDLMVYGHEIPGVPKGEVHLVTLATGKNPVPTDTLKQRILAEFPRNPAASAIIAADQPIVYLVTFPNGAPIALSDALAARILAQVGNPGRKVNDTVVVRGPNVCNYLIDATLTIRRGVDPASIIAAQRAAVLDYAAKRTMIGAPVTPSHITGQLVTSSADVIVDCTLRQPAAPIGGGPFDVPWLTGIALDWVYA